MKERLQKYIAGCGAASRRKSEQMIFDGRVRVNGEVVREIVTVDSEKDRVELDGRLLKLEDRMVYVVINKPVGVITSSKDQFGRKTVVDMVEVSERIYPVGRLDYDTSGLLILTNDGEVANRIAHPSKRVDKVYEAELSGILDRKDVEAFEGGLNIEDYTTSPARLRIIEAFKDSCRVEVTIHEGKNRQVRKMCEAIGHPVLRLKRIRIGNIEIGDLMQGQWRNMNDSEIAYLKSL